MLYLCTLLDSAFHSVEAKCKFAEGGGVRTYQATFVAVTFLSHLLSLADQCGALRVGGFRSSGKPSIHPSANARGTQLS